jgi:alpha-mannosidase
MASRRLTFHLIPHTHWDREWYLTRGQFGARLVDMMDDLIDLLHRQPDIPGFLLDGQTVLLEDYLRVRPDQQSMVSDLVARGRIETGPWYVLADEQIPSGEALIRNLLIGSADCRRWGRRMNVLYSPDAFGHPGILPLLAREFGIPYVAAWRGLPAGGGDLVHWRGPDGRPVLLYHLPPDGYEIGSNLSSDPALAPAAWQKVRQAVLSRARSRDIAVLVGADHHAAREDLTTLVTILQEGEAEHEVRLSRLQDFFDAAAAGSELATIDGEQRYHGHTWALQDVHSTRAHQKRRNSRLEILLQRFAEPLSTLAYLAGGRDRRALLRSTWRELVQCHFHDAIGGCASDDVARAVDVRFTDVEGATREMIAGSVADLTGHDPDHARERPSAMTPTLFLWNPAVRPRGGVVFATMTMFRHDILVGPLGGRVPRSGEGFRQFSLETPTGESIPVQILEVRRGEERLDARRHYPDQDQVDIVSLAFRSPEMAGYGASTLGIRPGENDAVVTPGRKRRIQNALVSVDIESDGSITLTNRASGRSYARILALEWEEDRGDTYTSSPGVSAAPLRPSRVRVTGVHRGPLISMIRAEWSLTAPRDRRRWSDRRIDVRLTLMVVDGEPAVRCTMELTNRATDQRLRLRCPTGLAGVTALAGGPLSVVPRSLGPVASETTIERVTLTAPAHRFVSAADTHGLGLFAPGFFEYELTPSGDLLYTLLRSTGQLSRHDLPTRSGHAGWPTATPLAQCPGHHTITFAVAPLAGRTCRDGARLERLWEDIFLPVQTRWLRDFTGRRGASDLSFGIELEGDGVVMSAVKLAEQGEAIVLRCYSLRDEPVEAVWRLGFEATRAESCRADESVLGTVPLEAHGRALRVSVPPRGVASVLLHIAK